VRPVLISSSLKLTGNGSILRPRGPGNTTYRALFPRREFYLWRWIRSVRLIPSLFPYLFISLLGVQLVLYVTCARHLWSVRKKNPKSMYLLAYITTLIILETIGVSAAANTVQLNWVDNRNYPGGPWQYFLDTQALPVNVMFYAFMFVMAFLSDILLVSSAETHGMNH